MSKDAGGSDPGREFQEIRRELAELQRENAAMRKDLANVAQAASIENVVQQGFERISNQLEPLRDMSARREYPGREAMEKFTAVQRAIAQPQWRGSNFEADFPHVGDHCQRSS